MGSLEEWFAIGLAIAVYTEQIVDFFSATTNNSAVSTALIVVLANASLGGNMTRIASVRAVAPAPNALGLANASLGVNVTRIASVPSPPPIDHYQNWSESKTGMVQPVPKPESQPELKEILCCKYTVRMFGPVYKQLKEAQRLRKIEFFRPWPSEISLQVRTDSNFLEISNVTFSEWEEIHEHDKKIRQLHRLGRVYNRFIEAQRRRKIEFFRPWPSEISLQVRTDSNFFEISNVTFSEWEEINEHYKRIREFYRLPTKEILPIRLLSFFYSLATQVLQQFNRVVAEVQLVVYEAFNYVSLLFLCPILALLCCLVKCKDDRTSLCWVLKLVSNRHPISGLCVHICDKIMESPTPTQPLSSGPDGVLETETENERIARLLAICKEMLSQSSEC
jgi:hypothetical protein